RNIASMMPMTIERAAAWSTWACAVGVSALRLVSFIASSGKCGCTIAHTLRRRQWGGARGWSPQSEVRVRDPTTLLYPRPFKQTELAAAMRRSRPLCHRFACSCYVLGVGGWCCVVHLVHNERARLTATGFNALGSAL